MVLLGRRRLGAAAVALKCNKGESDGQGGGSQNSRKGHSLHFRSLLFSLQGLEDTPPCMA